VIPNGVDVERFRPLATPLGLRERIGLPATAPVAAIVAALRPEKNHELFLRAAALARTALPAARFLVIGDGALRGQLETLASELGIGDAVHFLGTRNDIPELLSLVDVLVLSSHMEANPVSILEGLACEKTVVATRVGSIPETVKHGTNGYLVDPGDAQGMADRLVAVMSDAALAHNLGQAGRRLVVADWSLERMVEGYEQLIEQVYCSKVHGDGMSAFSDSGTRLDDAEVVAAL
jgi:glycosyltransferase involved in cell wall biosynthesis